MSRIGRLYSTIDIPDLLKVQPEGYQLAVLKIPFARKFRITWWVDADGNIA